MISQQKNLLIDSSFKENLQYSSPTNLIKNYECTNQVIQQRLKLILQTLLQQKKEYEILVNREKEQIKNTYQNLLNQRIKTISQMTNMALNLQTLLKYTRQDLEKSYLIIKQKQVQIEQLKKELENYKTKKIISKEMQYSNRKKSNVSIILEEIPTITIKDLDLSKKVESTCKHLRQKLQQVINIEQFDTLKTERKFSKKKLQKKYIIKESQNEKQNKLEQKNAEKVQNQVKDADYYKKMYQRKSLPSRKLILKQQIANIKTQDLFKKENKVIKRFIKV